ncbi:hypothetical protein [Epilithonimonas sp.]|uniref:hypothetical protein n=1 Tax=Epilithonimonas sp. TaxID=2894511 RepID=UPI002FDCA933
MNYEQLQFNLNAYKETGEILDAARFLIHEFELDDENFLGFGFREELEKNSVLLTANGEIGDMQEVMIPRNLFDFDLTLVLNLLAHEMLHVRQKSPKMMIMDKNEREWQAYYEMLFHTNFPQIPELSDYYKNFFGEKALIYYGRMGERSELQQKYAEQKAQLEAFLQDIKNKTNQ